VSPRIIKKITSIKIRPLRIVPRMGKIFFLSFWNNPTTPRINPKRLTAIPPQMKKPIIKYISSPNPPIEEYSATPAPRRVSVITIPIRIEIMKEAIPTQECFFLAGTLAGEPGGSTPAAGTAGE
jgi:hypothetical protein